MKINFDAVLIDFTGDPILLHKDGPQATLKDLAIISLKNPLPEDTTAAYEDKLALAKMGKQIFEGEEISSTQAGILKERVCKYFPNPAITYAVEKVIEG